MDIASLTLPHSPRASALAREWLAKQMLAWHRPENVDTAMLVVTELITSSLCYASGSPILVLDVLDGALRPAVHDNSADRPELSQVYRDAQGGRGMWLIAGPDSCHLRGLRTAVGRWPACSHGAVG